MKKADLEKKQGMKIQDRLRHAPASDRFGSASALPDRREQRKLDQAQGLIPFAVKLPEDLVERVRAYAAAGESGINEAVAELLTRALDQEASAS
jgi:hypothetical protein